MSTHKKWDNDQNSLINCEGSRVVSSWIHNISTHSLTHARVSSSLPCVIKRTRWKLCIINFKWPSTISHFLSFSHSHSMSTRARSQTRFCGDKLANNRDHHHATHIILLLYGTHMNEWKGRQKKIVRWDETWWLNRAYAQMTCCEHITKIYSFLMTS